MIRYASARYVIVFCAVLLAGLVPAATLAQTTDRAGIEGRVVDESGGVLPGVTVSISSSALQGGARVVVTDSSGRYRFAELPAGDYTVTFTLSGFAVVKASVHLGTGFVATMDEKMAVGGVAESALMAN